MHVWPLGPNLGQCCGGSVTTLIETFDATDLDSVRELAAAEEAGPFITVSRMTAQGRIAREIGDKDAGIAEAGEPPSSSGSWNGSAKSARRCCCSGPAMSAARSFLPCRSFRFRCAGSTRREDHFPDFVPANVITIRTDAPEREIDAAPPGAFAVIMTHSHPLDYSIAAAALRRPDFGFVGLIGSATKRARFASQAEKLGISEQQIARLVCPIGLPDIRDKEPSVIAAGVAAQLLIERERDSRHASAAAGLK